MYKVFKSILFLILNENHFSKLNYLSRFLCLKFGHLQNSVWAVFINQSTNTKTTMINSMLLVQRLILLIDKIDKCSELHDFDKCMDKYYTQNFIIS